MGQTQFQKATRHFVEGAVDPRLLLSYFEELRPALYEENSSLASLSEDKYMVSSQDDYIEVEIYAGVDQHRPSETNIDDISECWYPSLEFFKFHAPLCFFVYWISALNFFTPRWRTKNASIALYAVPPHHMILIYEMGADIQSLQT